MKRNSISIIQKTLSLALALLFTLLPTVALAAVGVTLEADKTSVRVGDTVEIRIAVTGANMAIAEGSYTYNPSVLAYIESEGGASDGFFNLASAQRGGADSLVASIRFEVVGEGDSEIAFSIDNVVGYDGKPQGGAKGVLAISATAPTAAPSPQPLNYATEGVPAQNVKDAPGEMYIWRSLKNVTIPSNYTETTLTYRGETVAAATVPDSDAPTLLYLSTATGESGGYYIYNPGNDALYPYQTISSVSKTYILLRPDGSVPVPEGFSETTLTVGERNYAAWKSQDAQGDIYLLYARNPGGEVGYYVFNAEDESLQRYAVMPARPLSPALPSQTPPAIPADPAATLPADENVGITLSPALFYILCSVTLLLLLAVAGLLVLRYGRQQQHKRGRAQRKAQSQSEKDSPLSS